MNYWSLILHFYQPPTQELSITKEVLESCYLPLLRMLSKKSHVGLTFNISGSLLVQLKELDANEFFDLVKRLIEEKKIEIVTSVMYHPLMPLTPKDVLIRQIEKNSQTLKDLLGVEKLEGFFPPELAVNVVSLELVNTPYIVIDETALPTKSKPQSLIKYGKKYLLVNNRQVCELMRAYPKRLSAERVVTLAQRNRDEKDLVIIANDAELFGHHYSERLDVLADLLDRKNITFIKASEVVTMFGSSAISISSIKASTWQDSQGFNLWTKTPLQRKYLKFLKEIYELSLDHSGKEVLDFLDQGYSSCYLYWLSNWPWWHPDLVESGAAQLIRAVRRMSIPNEEKSRLEKMYYRFLQNLWQYHWSGKVETKYRERDEKLLKTKNN
ncbi:MAG: hypothetical protein AAB553_06100 [Patescibacteria group bacterium]